MSCGCCECLSGATLAPSTYNRPGLSRITRRIGTYGSFLDTMIARLASLPALTTREADDPAIALLDAWAVVGDVLTFYQERIANEGYLRTATERLSILELARLVGYRLRPGVSASVHVAYKLDDGAKTIIPAGAQVQSSGTSDEQPQTFETSEEIAARGDWNAIEPRMKEPQVVERETWQVWLAGANLNLKAGDWLLFDFGNEVMPRRAVAVDADHTLDRTRVSFVNFDPRTDYRVDDPIEALLVPSSIAPRTSQHLARTLRSSFAEGSSNSIVALTQFHPQLSSTIWTALANYTTRVAPPDLQGIYVLRARAALFGYNAPPVYAASVNENKVVQFTRPEDVNPFPESTNVLYLDQVYEGVLPGGFILAHTTGSDPRVLHVREADAQTRSEYGISTKTTRLETVENFWNAQSTFSAVIRRTAIFVQSEKLELTDQPIDTPIGTQPDDEKTGLQSTFPNGEDQEDPRAIRIELGAFYEGLDSGRYVIVEGERLDVPGVRSAELAMLARVEQKIGQGQAGYTILHFANPLAWFYKRDTVRVYANVVKATHGATQREILGSGDGTMPLQPFDLRQKPLTYVAAATPNGIASTLNVRVSDLLWHETDSIGSAGPADHVYATDIADGGTVTVTFGTGTHGARLPTGADNVRAVYRYGIGTAGNVGPGRINNAITRPTGVTGVNNPLTASGGAGPESRDSARSNAPLAVQALDRLVSVRDYEDFARTFAGIAKASAARFTRGRRQFVHLTIAGQDDIPILETSDLYKALAEAVVKYGDVAQPVRLDLREARLMAGSARVRIHPDYLWESVAGAITAALQMTFSFDARTLAQPVFPSEVIATIQAVPGVEYVDLDALDGFTAEELTSDDPTLGERLEEAGVTTIPSLLAHYDTDDVLHPAQVVYLSPQLPDAFVLTEIPQ
jgi:Baseplate J-like protein